MTEEAVLENWKYFFRLLIDIHINRKRININE